GGEPRSLDPHFDTFPYNTAVTTNTNSGLIRFTRDLREFELDLAAEMPEQPDELTYIFRIRQGVKFHDVDPVFGRELTSEDVKYSIERQMTNDPGRFQHAYFFLGKLDRIETPDRYTVRFVTRRPFAPFLSYIASPWTQVICREAVEKYGDLTQHAVGTGPFIFREWQRNVQIVLERNPNYFKQGLPYVDRFVARITTDPNTAATQFIDEQVDATITDYSQLDRVQSSKPEANYQARPSQFWKQMRMPPNTPDKARPAPYDDKRVREAIAHAVHKQEEMDLVYSGDGVLTYGPILPIYEKWALQEELVPHDLKKARDLLSAAGLSGGHQDTMIFATNPINDQIGEVLQQQLRQIGWDVTLQPMELAAYYNKTYAYDYTLSHHTPLNNPDPDENLSSYFGRNSTYYKYYPGRDQERIWDLIDRQAETLDEEERQQLVREVQELIVLDYPMVFLLTNNNHHFTQPWVKGWFYGVDLYDGRIETVWIDR
ncbi:MAG TPA: ABC transporter substrate-binding protein, partial [Dehalococcoidia bacterium]